MTVDTLTVNRLFNSVLAARLKPCEHTDTEENETQAREIIYKGIQIVKDSWHSGE